MVIAIKPYGMRSEQRAFEQNYYGGYCSKARECGLEPISYVVFQDKLSEAFNLNLTRKGIMNMLIEFTHLCNQKGRYY